jgi:hypothetical protein
MASINDDRVIQLDNNDDDDDATEELPTIKKARHTSTHNIVIVATPSTPLLSRPSPATCHMVQLKDRRTTWAHSIPFSSIFAPPPSAPSSSMEAAL